MERLIIVCPVPGCIKTFKMGGTLARHMKDYHPKIYDSIPGRQSRRKHGHRKFLDIATALTLTLNDKKDFPIKIKV